MTETGYTAELTLAKDLARKSGKIMRDHFIAGTTRKWKLDKTPVTIADTEINSFVIDEIAKAFPDDAVIGEEQSNLKDTARKWVCDPVDGTMAFSHALQISTFSLALTVDGRPVMGVVYDPFMARLFSAVTGQGAFMNDEPIHVSNNGMENALIDCEGFPGSKPVLKVDRAIYERLENLGANTQHMWSVILPSALVAAGQYTATIFNVTKPEDGAAIKVIIEEAGGRVTDLFGNEQRYDGPVKGFLASNGVVHQQILDVLATYDVA